LRFFIILIKKQDSPDANPASHCGSPIFLSLITGLSTGFIFKKDVFNLSDKPLFIEALIAKICLNPSKVKCSLFLIISTARLHSS